MLFQTSMTYVTSVEQTKLFYFNYFSSNNDVNVNGVQNNLDPSDLCCIDEKTLRHLLKHVLCFTEKIKFRAT